MDETIVRQNSFPHFVRFVARQMLRERNYRGLIVLTLTAGMRRLGLASHCALKETVHRLASDLDDTAVAAWCEWFVSASARDDVCEYVEAWPGTRWLATAAPEVYAVHIGRLLGFDVVQGSGWVAGRYVDNQGETKARRLRASGLHEVDVAISDDPAVDGPLLAMARMPVTVRADKAFTGPVA
jgi:phosphoserine phosphatase